jgi:hypothetical protein
MALVDDRSMGAGAAPMDEDHKGENLHEVNLIIDKLLAVRGTRSSTNMQVRLGGRESTCRTYQ